MRKAFRMSVNPGAQVCQRWWRFMRELMPSNPDGSPVARDLLEVFHLGNVE
jgi:L-rhamnose mutarotase